MLEKILWKVQSAEMRAKGLLQPFAKRTCRACGAKALLHRSWIKFPKVLADEWELTDELRRAFGAREMDRCVACGCSLRAIHLAGVLVSEMNARLGLSATSLVALCNEPAFRQLHVAELNSAGGLHQFLSALPRLSYSEYGSQSPNVRSENLLHLTYPDQQFDLVIDSETLEHVPDAPRALGEIHRVLKRGAAHIFTVPVRWDRRSIQRARIVDGQLQHLLAPSYHGDTRARLDDYLVFYEYGNDFEALQREVGFVVCCERDPENPALTVFIATRADA